MKPINYTTTGNTDSLCSPTRFACCLVVLIRTRKQTELEESENTAMLNSMNAAQVIEEINALPAEEQSKVIAHLHKAQEERFHENLRRNWMPLSVQSASLRTGM